MSCACLTVSYTTAAAASGSALIWLVINLIGYMYPITQQMQHVVLSCCMDVTSAVPVFRSYSEMLSENVTAVGLNARIASRIGLQVGNLSTGYAHGVNDWRVYV